MKFYLCGFVLLPSQFCSDLSQNTTRSWLQLGSSSSDVIRVEIQRSVEKNLDLSSFYCVKKWMLLQPGSVMAHKSGQFWWNYKTTRREILVTVSEFMTVLPLQMLPNARVAELSRTELRISDKYDILPHLIPDRQLMLLLSPRANDFNISPDCVSPGDRREN